MADENNAPEPQRSQAEGSRGGRAPQREPGGFRIRLSDNEMRAVRAVQDAFQLRSPVAALGFSVRTLGQMLEQGQLDELIAQQRAQGGNRRSDGPRSDGPRSDGRGGGGGGGGGRRPWGNERPERGGPRIDPFARPRKPVVAAEEAGEPADAPPEADSKTEAAVDTTTVPAETISAESVPMESFAADSAPAEPETATAEN